MVGVAIENVAVGGDQAQPRHVGRIGAELRAGAVRGGGDGAGQRLVVDVRHVRQRLTDLEQWLADLRHRRPGRKLGLQAPRVVADQAAQLGEGDDLAVGRHQGAERVPRADRADAHVPRALDELCQLILAGRRQARGGDAALDSGPVPPGDDSLGGCRRPPCETPDHPARPGCSEKSQEISSRHSHRPLRGLPSTPRRISSPAWSPPCIRSAAPAPSPCNPCMRRAAACSCCR